MPNSAATVARWLSLNDRWHTPRTRRGLTLLVFALAAAAYTRDAQRAGGLNAPPPIGGDAVLYDSLAWELAAGRGFALDLGNPEFLEPYVRAQPANAEWFAAQAPTGPIASRPPLLPWLMAGLNRVLGRQFRGVRLLNVVSMAAVAAAVAWSVCRLAGPLPALIAALQFVVLDPRTRLAARDVLTESLACLLVTLLSFALYDYRLRPRLKAAAFSGGLLGLAILLRSMFVLWAPVVALWLWAAPRFVHRAAGAGQRHSDTEPASHSVGSSQGTPFRFRGLLAAMTFLAAAGLVVAPWGIRNCRLLGRMMPLGTQGTMELSAGYSDAAFERLGMWHNLEQAGFFDEIRGSAPPGIEWELARADYSLRKAIEWCRAQPVKVGALPFLKVVQEFRPHGSGDLYVLAFALLGWLWLRGTPSAAVGGGILAATAFGVALTWSSAGRFVVPALFVLHVAAAIGVWHSLIACVRCAPQAGACSSARNSREQ